VVEVLSGRVVRNPVLVACSMGIGARVPQPIVITTSEALTASVVMILGCSVGTVDALSATAWTATGMIRIRCLHCSAPTGRTAIRKPQRSIQNRFRLSIAKSVCRITNLEESLSRTRRHAAPRSHIGCAAREAPIAVAVGAAAVWGCGGAKRRDQVVVPVFGMQD